ncbi:MAG: VanZ family protein [Colwellia sp.]|nr:VanZ family protein [Colwellia sp.]MCW8864402.1 VanZ family protein [Colwellia sp.]MCW9080815.1 VanZ family protein [Colwellia sp.]
MKARHHLLFFILLLIAACLLFFSSALLLPTELKNAVFRSPQIDTIGHFIGFFVLAWLMHSILKTTLVSTFFSLSFYACLSELGQYYLGFRNGEFSDFFADIAGIALFILLKVLYLFYKKALLAKLSANQSNSAFTAKVDS